MAPVRRWNPTYTMLMPLDSHEYAAPDLDREHPPPRNGLPERVPYAYRGSDFTLPIAVTIAEAAPLRRPSRRKRPLNDPEWLAAAVPFSAPLEWLRELEAEAS